ncbi:hypothetical protein C8R42DRAFT_635459 [Lentinula raphanica]|nr:hypothetical protein C8R42DRAFT_635459 [Lentinula raphanica]
MSTQRDFCNSFWSGSGGAGDGASGQAGVNVLFSRIRGAQRTLENLRAFWEERGKIEEEYGRRLVGLGMRKAEGGGGGVFLGKDEIGEVRNSLSTLELETHKLGQAHLSLASQIRKEIEEPCALLLSRVVDWRRTVMGPVEKKFKMKAGQESYVAKAKEKYYADCARIGSYTQQIAQLVDQESSSSSSAAASASDIATELQKARTKLKRAEQSVGSNEKDYGAFTKALADMMPGWERDWKEFCDRAQDLEEERIDFLKDNLWAYANAVSSVCVADDESCETIRTVLDQLETDRDLLGFVQEYGTGNLIPNPPEFIPYNPATTSSSSSSNVTSTRPARFIRSSSKNDRLTTTTPPPPPAAATTASAAPPYAAHNNSGTTNTNSTISAPPPGPPPSVPPPNVPGQGQGQGVGRGGQTQPQTQTQAAGNGNGAPLDARTAAALERRLTLPPQPNTENGGDMTALVPPMPTATGSGGTTGVSTNGSKILFYVEALYDYTATIPEEFNFQAGDIIAVTDIPDDGWWSGELLDEKRREEGRNVFPSNFVRLF